jgi:GxxExxY protein
LVFGKALAIITGMITQRTPWSKRQYDHVSGRIIKHAIEVHSLLGPGLFEHVYEKCLADELMHVGLAVETQVEIPIRFKEKVFESGYRAGIIVEDRILVELKSVSRLFPVHEAQVLTYIRLGGFRVGLLMNFNEHRLRSGLKRFANRF